jgi:hypothetical protein
MGRDDTFPMEEIQVERRRSPSFDVERILQAVDRRTTALVTAFEVHVEGESRRYSAVYYALVLGFIGYLLDGQEIVRDLFARWNVAEDTMAKLASGVIGVVAAQLLKAAIENGSRKRFRELMKEVQK